MSALVIGALLMRPQEAVNGSQQAMRAWFTSVAPSLFPFIAMMPGMVSQDACRIYDRFLSAWMHRAFDLPGRSASAIMIAMITGSPGGAIAVRRVAQESCMRRDDAKRLALAMCGLSPAYLLMGVGCGLYGSVCLGWRLIFLQVTIQLILLRILKWLLPEEETRFAAAPDTMRSGVGAAVETVMGVCGYMVVFGAIASVVASFVGSRVGMLVQLLLDLPGGSAALSKSGMKDGLLLQCAALGFGGICIGAQNMEVLATIGVKWSEYLAVRATAAALFVIGGGILEQTDMGSEGLMEKTGAVLPFIVFAACFLMAPGLIYRKKNSFLNK